MEKRIRELDWQEIASSMHEKGYALIPGVLNPGQCGQLISLYDNHTGFRKTVNMERYRFGRGEYKYFDYPLPATLQVLREQVYPYLVPVANKWMQVLKIDNSYPDALKELHALCHKEKQALPTPLILKYGKGGYNTLHQDLYGTVYFPFQLVLFLNEAGVDYTGGEFVLLEQVPRAQSRPIVLSPERGDMLIFTTNFRPVKGKRGYYRANMKHGVCEVHSGQRHTAGIIFHEATT